MIENIRGLVDVVPRLNIFGDDTACPSLRAGEGEDRLASSRIRSARRAAFDPAARARVKRDADALMEQFAGYFGSCGRARGRARAEGGVMAARVHQRVRTARQRLRDRTCCASSPSSAASP